MQYFCYICITILITEIHYLNLFDGDISNLLRNFISILPNSIKNILTDIIAFLIYFPLAKISLAFSYLGINTKILYLYHTIKIKNFT